MEYYLCRHPVYFMCCAHGSLQRVFKISEKTISLWILVYTDKSLISLNNLQNQLARMF